MTYKGGVLLEIEGRAGGSWAKCPSPSSPPRRTEERRGARHQRPIPAPWGTAAAGVGGKAGRGTRGFQSRPHLGLRWLVVAAPRAQAEAGGGALGGGAVELGVERGWPAAACGKVEGV